MPAPLIRRATPADVAQLLPLVADYWRFEGISGFDRERSGAELTRLLSQAQLGAGWLALDASMAIGYLLLAHVFSLEHGGITAEIDELYVAPAARSRGAGTALLAAAELECVRAGHVGIALQLARGNAPGRAFYRARGYRERAGYELLHKALTAAR